MSALVQLGKWSANESDLKSETLKNKDVRFSVQRLVVKYKREAWSRQERWYSAFLIDLIAVLPPACVKYKYMLVELR